MNNLVSIITPAYNSAFFIERTIKSIISQTYLNWELIIVDDNSNDETVEIVNKYSNKDERIKLIQLLNNSGSAVLPRNTAIDFAKGKYIAFCDSDDQWRNEKLEKQINYMIKFDLAFSYTNYDIIDERGIYIKTVKSPSKITYRKLLRNNYIGCLTVVYDTAKLGKLFIPSIRIGEDWALWLSILKKTSFSICLNESLSIYTERSKSISSNRFSSIKHIWNVYRKIEHFSMVKSCLYFLQYLIFYFIKFFFAK